ncbi:MAG: DUF488 domain-containing protein [Rhizobiales bacterium]|nr:DUF488 domain-containing protein [Hyphomicrobiales bacterium]
MDVADIRLKRAYEVPAPDDGVRILVERLWPRGVKKSDAAIDHWVKDISPSPELRKWFGHRPELWGEFRQRYAAELRQNADGVADLRKLCASGRVTFVFAAKDQDRNSAVLLRDFLLGGGKT